MTTTDREAEAGTEQFRTVKSAERALLVLEIVSAAPGPLSVAELHRRTGYPRSSLHQLLHTISAMGWLEISPDSGTVSIGSRALIVGTSYLDRDPALPHAVLALERVRDRSGYTTHYARLDGANVLYLATRETTQSRRATSRVGRRLPAHATALGKALLADLTAEERRSTLGDGELVSLMPNTIVDHRLLEEDLERTRERGFAFEREENTPGVACVSATVGYRIPATDAISCSLPLDAAGEDEISRVSELLLDETARLARTLKAAGVR
ncbi:IclR family transcriptional regulator domain-containing protein [Phytoactinopolyspora mesophila]|uniref:IclR family transcriptional regulator domain-containing protein n=1 Tax=Phytoactinopolyspora mesophila TaxID=2650750 RepID=UPI001575677B